MGGIAGAKERVGSLDGSGLVPAAEETLPPNPPNPNRNYHIRGLLGSAAVFLALVGSGANISEANAAGPLDFAVFGGTPAQRATVHEALDASKFDWSILKGKGITVHIKRNLPSSQSSPDGNVLLDAGLLNTGKFAWGEVDHEFAHQVDFQVLTDTDHQELRPLLGGNLSAWCPSDDAIPMVPHWRRACERFASMVAWAYWQSPDNIMRPISKNDESAAAPPARFRGLLDALLKAHRLSESASNHQVASEQSDVTTVQNGYSRLQPHLIRPDA